MPFISLQQMYDTWKRVSDWVSGASADAPKVQLTGRKASLATADFSQVLNVAASGQTTITVTPPVGQLWRMKIIRVKLLQPGAASGTHRLMVRSGINDYNGVVLDLTSNYTDALEIYANTIVSGTAVNGKIPTTEQAQQTSILNTVATNAAPLYITYLNNTNVIQNNTITLMMAWEVENIG